MKVKIKDCRSIISNLQKGNILKCKDGDEMLNYEHEITKLGFKTEFVYSWKGESGYYILITDVPGGDSNASN